MNKFFLATLSFAFFVSAHAESIGSSSRSNNKASTTASTASKPTPSKQPNAYAGGYKRNDLVKPPAAVKPPLVVNTTKTPLPPVQKQAMVSPNIVRQQQSYAPTPPLKPTQRPQFTQPNQPNTSGISTGAKIATGVALGAVGGAVLANVMSDSQNQRVDNTQYQQVESQPTQVIQPPNIGYNQNTPDPQVVYQQAPVYAQPQVRIVERIVVKEVPAQSTGGFGFFWIFLIVALISVSVVGYYVIKRKGTKEKFDAFRKASKELASSVGTEAYKDVGLNRPKHSYGVSQGITIPGNAPGEEFTIKSAGSIQEKLKLYKIESFLDPIAKFDLIQKAFAEGNKEKLKVYLSADYYNEILSNINTTPKEVTVVCIKAETLQPDDKVFSVLYTYTDKEDGKTYKDVWHFDRNTYVLVGIQPF
jgi:hypothetical protein